MAQSYDLKLRRAKEHLDALESLLDTYRELDPYDVDFDPDIEERRLTVRLQCREEIPEELPLLIGEWAHNLRGALDHVTNEIVSREGVRADWSDVVLRSRLKKSQFPICDCPVDFTKHAAKCLKGVAPVTITVFDSLQPYGDRKTENSACLKILRDISNVDKHRHVTVAAARTKEFSIALGGLHFGDEWTQTVEDGPLKHGASVALVQFSPGVDMDVSVKVEGKMEVALYHGVTLIGPASAAMRCAQFAAEQAVGTLKAHLLTY